MCLVQKLVYDSKEQVVHGEISLDTHNTPPSLSARRFLDVLLYTTKSIPSLTKLGLQHFHRINIPTRLLNRPQRRQTQLPLLLISFLLPPRLGLGAPARRDPRKNPIAIMRREVDKVVEAGSRRFRRLDVAQRFGRFERAA